MTAPAWVRFSLGAAGDRLGDAEVGDLHLPGRRDEDVAGLHVAVDDAVAVGEAERGGDVRGDLGGAPGVQRALGADDLREAAALDVLHDDEVGAVLLAPVVDGHDVGVVEVGRGLGLTTEPLDEVGSLAYSGNRSKIPHMARSSFTISGSTMVLAARSWDFLSLPNCAPEVFVHARRHVFVVRIRDVFAYRLRVQETVTANAAMPLLAGEDVWTPLGVFRIVFGMGNF